MTAKDESLFVVMDALNQVRGRRRAEKHRSHSHDFTRRVAASFEKTVSSLTITLLFLVAICHHIQTICVSMMIAQCQPHLA